MLNILIADDNIDYARNLMHLINFTSDNIRVSDISINGKETFEILNKPNNIDIVLLDLKMPFLSGLEIMKKLSFEQRKKYTNSFIIISGETLLIKQVRSLNSKLVYKVLSKSLTFDCIIDNINNLINERIASDEYSKIKSKITSELTSIGYSLSHNGTHYLIDIIEMIYYRGIDFVGNLNTSIYPLIAKRYNQSPNNIKTSIIRATDAMYYNCHERRLLDFFGLTVLRKPNVKSVINTIILKLKNN